MNEVQFLKEARRVLEVLEDRGHKVNRLSTGTVIVDGVLFTDSVLAYWIQIKEMTTLEVVDRMEETIKKENEDKSRPGYITK